MSDCVFCRTIKRQLPAGKVYEDEATIAFIDLGQVNPGHVIVATQSEVKNLYGLGDALAGAALRTTLEDGTQP